MKQKQDGGGMFRWEEWEALAAELVKIPKEHRPQVQRDVAIFIAGMEQTHNLEAAMMN